MPDYIEKSEAMDLDPKPKEMRQYNTSNLDDAYESGWYDAQAELSQLPPAWVFPAEKVEESVYEAIRILNAINAGGRLYYADYSQLHDAIAAIILDAED